MTWLSSLKQMKAASGLTTSEISKGSGIPVPTLEKLFSGSTKAPQLATMQKLVYFLGFTLEDLFPDTKKSPTPSEYDVGEKVEPEKVWNLLIEMGFIESGQDLTDADLRFLMAVGEIIKAWFADKK